MWIDEGAIGDFASAANVLVSAVPRTILTREHTRRVDVASFLSKKTDPVGLFISSITEYI